MKAPAHAIEIFLQPGEFYFGDEGTRIRTLLGSCVAVVLWHPRLRIGGMSHYMLPTRSGRPGTSLDGRYADEAMGLFMAELRRTGTHPSDYHVKLFGGGDMLSLSRESGCQASQCDPATMEARACRNVSCKNAVVAAPLVRRHGFNVTAEHLGGSGHRQVIFDIWSGHAWVRQHRNTVFSQHPAEELATQ